MTELRAATVDDIDAIVRLGEVMHAESRYSRMAYSAERVRACAAALIESADGLALVVEAQGQVVGGILATVAAPWFSDEPMASDVAIFIDPAHRGGRLVVRLMQRYALWAVSRGAVIVAAGVSSGVDTERTVRLFERLGWRPCAVGLEWSGDVS